MAILFSREYIQDTMRLDSPKALGELTVPALFVSADSDRLRHRTQTNFDQYGGPKQQVVVEGADHTFTLMGLLKSC